MCSPMRVERYYVGNTTRHFVGGFLLWVAFIYQRINKNQKERKFWSAGIMRI